MKIQQQGQPAGSKTFGLARCQIDVNPKVFAIGVIIPDQPQPNGNSTKKPDDNALLPSQKHLQPQKNQ